MKLRSQDWQRLRYPLIALGTALIAMTLLVSYMEQHKAGAEQALAAQQAKLLQARQKYQASDVEKETISKYLPLYQELINKGFIGEERRIEWVDSLRTIHQQNKLFDIKYTIGQQENYKPSFATMPGGFTLYRSIMKLELSMLHEGDLLTLLQGLEARHATPFMLRECEINRLALANSAVLAPSMMARCELDWLTIREPQTGTIPSP